MKQLKCSRSAKRLRKNEICCPGVWLVKGFCPSGSRSVYGEQGRLPLERSRQIAFFFSMFEMLMAPVGYVILNPPLIEQSATGRVGTNNLGGNFRVCLQLHSVILLCLSSKKCSRLRWSARHQRLESVLIGMHGVYLIDYLI